MLNKLSIVVIVFLVDFAFQRGEFSTALVLVVELIRRSRIKLLGRHWYIGIGVCRDGLRGAHLLHCGPWGLCRVLGHDYI